MPILDTPPPYRALLFDFDGTLADSYPAITASVNHVRASHGLPPLQEVEVRRQVGHGPGYLLEHTVGVGESDSNEALYRAHHPSVMEAGTRLLPGVATTLPVLHRAGFSLAVCSNKPVRYTRQLLAHLQIASLFRAVLGPEDVAHPKPSPEMLLAALQRLGVSPQESLYVGDMTIDITTARAAGVCVWIIPTGSDDRETLVAAKPDRLLERFEDLIELCLDQS